MGAGVKIIVGLTVMWIVFTILSCIVDGTAYMMSGTQSSALGWLTSFNTASMSWYTIPFVVMNFFTTGLPAMIAWDYSFLEGWSGGEMIRLIGRSVSTIIIVWSIVVWVLPAMVSLLSNIAGGLTGLFRPR